MLTGPPPKFHGTRDIPPGTSTRRLATLRRRGGGLGMSGYVHSVSGIVRSIDAASSSSSRRRSSIAVVSFMPATERTWPHRYTWSCRRREFTTLVLLIRSRRLGSASNSARTSATSPESNGIGMTESCQPKYSLNEALRGASPMRTAPPAAPSK